MVTYLHCEWKAVGLVPAYTQQKKWLVGQSSHQIRGKIKLRRHLWINILWKPVWVTYLLQRWQCSVTVSHGVWLPGFESRLRQLLRKSREWSQQSQRRRRRRSRHGWRRHWWRHETCIVVCIAKARWSYWKLLQEQDKVETGSLRTILDLRHAYLLSGHFWQRGVLPTGGIVVKSSFSIVLFCSYLHAFQLVSFNGVYPR